MTSEEEHRVLEFRPRSSARPSGRPTYPHGQAEPQNARPENIRPQPNDLSRDERSQREPDDVGHRMLANVATIAFAVAVAAIGIWLFVSISDLRRTQDCLMKGRHDCASIYAPQG